MADMDEPATLGGKRAGSVKRAVPWATGEWEGVVGTDTNLKRAVSLPVPEKNSEALASLLKIRACGDTAKVRR